MDEKRKREIVHNLRTDMLINAIKNDPGFHEVAFALLETFNTCVSIKLDEVEEKQYNEFISNKNYRAVMNTDKNFDENSKSALDAKEMLDTVVRKNKKI